MPVKQNLGSFSEDFLIDLVVRTRHFLVRNKKTVILSIIITVAVLLFIVMRVLDTKKAEEEASVAFERIALVFQRPDLREHIGDIEKQLDDIIKKWPGTLGAARAALRMGHMRYSLENYAAAMEDFARVSGYSSSMYLYPAGLLGIANCHEQTGNIESALETYSRIEVLNPDFGFKNLARLGKARCLGLKGDFQGARQALENVRQDHSPHTEQAEQILVWLEGLQERSLLPGN
ncbi:MAG: tetratricopeptide repeat protein [Spirochaetota bacterium]|jgi:predicted negative regulator of RcsB-dependent stress response|nr:tetratricopeptide repeat protein [Spirochaetota bacterium]